MSKYEMVMKYYAAGIWDKEKVKGAVKRGLISAEEYKELTGEEYVVE